jgi:hypothetical protein
MCFSQGRWRGLGRRARGPARAPDGRFTAAHHLVPFEVGTKQTQDEGGNKNG